MAMALGRFAEEEYKPNLHKLGQQIKGQRGLLFSNKPVEEVLRYVNVFFATYLFSVIVLSLLQKFTLFSVFL